LSATQEILPPYIATTYIIKASSVAAVPAVSEVGLILLTLLLVVAGAIVIQRLRRTQAQS
jgi:hypothetical protein